MVSVASVPFSRGYYYVFFICMKAFKNYKHTIEHFYIFQEDNKILLRMRHWGIIYLSYVRNDFVEVSHIELRWFLLPYPPLRVSEIFDKTQENFQERLKNCVDFAIKLMIMLKSIALSDRKKLLTMTAWILLPLCSTFFDQKSIKIARKRNFERGKSSI